MRKIEFIEDGYEIVVVILNHVNTSENESSIIEVEAYYKDFEYYRILVLAIAETEEKAVELATRELLTNHPFEQVMKDY